ncbi:flagellum-specific ATP synthase FliI [Paucibacter sp. KBW04]|uniref:FliI/YscN family ATPase n=1 Tax=Paucibacter sp. KBW04 TaxID=2153361 RepID=UPI000F5866FC|nr:FliI/YscN family ATPase [Paucibacter sp. KBW04]RQO63595.1 flagellum-specific ATP synthase FliI [Paucibacter sp. KBW04]
MSKASSPDLRSVARNFPIYQWSGKVSRVQSLGVESTGPICALGDLVEIRWAGQKSQAEVIALREGRVTLLPYGDTKGLTVGAEVVALETAPSVPVGMGYLGRVVDAFGVPLDGLPGPSSTGVASLRRKPLNPLLREPISERVFTGIRVIDGLLPLGRGQRLGIFAGSGIGKSSLMGMLARNVQADVNVVALIGERGREVQDFIEHCLSQETRSHTILVVATSDEPAVVRARAAYTATAYAEYFRDQGNSVFLLMDSVTRFAMARREIDLAAGQPPTSRGYTPSVFSEIPALCERCGSIASGGAITAMYTVLVEGDDHNEPIADTLRATLDGQIVLSRELANEGHFPAVDLLKSISRLERQVADVSTLDAANRLRGVLSVHHRHREMVEMGLYKAGTNPELDQALLRIPGITQFLRQKLDEVSSFDQTYQSLCRALTESSGVVR